MIQSCDKKTTFHSHLKLSKMSKQFLTKNIYRLLIVISIFQTAICRYHHIKSNLSWYGPVVVTTHSANMFTILLRNDIKSYGKISIFSKLKIDPETPPHPQFFRSHKHKSSSYTCKAITPLAFLIQLKFGGHLNMHMNAYTYIDMMTSHHIHIDRVSDTFYGPTGLSRPAVSSLLVSVQEPLDHCATARLSR